MAGASAMSPFDTHRLSPPPVSTQSSGVVISRTRGKSEDRTLSKVAMPPGRWEFSKEYQRYDKKAWTKDGTGYLQCKCVVTVYDYGVLDDGEPIYRINGKDADATHSIVLVSSAEEMLRSFPRNFFEELPAWCNVRWIDVEGVNGEIVQFCLHLMKCERHYAFNTLVDGTQRPMGLILDSDGDDTNFMLVTQVADLSDEAEGVRRGEVGSFYEVPPKTSVVEYEQVSYLLHLPEVALNGYGMLVSIQQGKEGDPYGGVRQEIKDGSTLLYARRVQHLFMKLVDASSDRLWGIRHFIAAMSEQLDNDMDRTVREQTFAYAQSLEDQCRQIYRTLQPFEASIKDLLALSETDLITGKAKPAWKALQAQHKRFLENIQAQEDRAKAIVGRYWDAKQKQEEERQRRIEQSQKIVGVFLSVFSPLSFITGIYGMNFTNPVNGQPSMPELLWGFDPVDPDDPSAGFVVTHPTGYEYFGMLCATAVVLVLTLYIYLGLIIGPREVVSLAAKTFTSARTSRRSEPPKDAIEDHEDEDRPVASGQQVIYV